MASRNVEGIFAQNPPIFPKDPEQRGCCFYYACTNPEFKQFIPSILSEKIYVPDGDVQDLIHDWNVDDEDNWIIELFLARAVPNNVNGKRLDIFLIDEKYYKIFNMLLSQPGYVPCRETYDVFQSQVRTLDLMREQLLDMLTLGKRQSEDELSGSRKRSRYDL